MHYYIIPKLNLIVGWNPKVACTTIFYLLLAKLNHKIKGNIHLDMINKENQNQVNMIYIFFLILNLKILI